MTQPSTDLALPSEQRGADLTHQIRAMEAQFAMAAPRGVEATQIVRDSLTVIRQTPKLMECYPQSVLGGLMTMAQLGLRVGVLGHGWLVPFWDKKFQWVDAQGRKRTGAHLAQLIIGYQGMVELAHRSSRIKSISARTVHANDLFDIEYGVEEKLVHKPAAGERGEPIGYYAVVRFLPDGYSFFHMTKAEMEVYRDRYAMAKVGGKVVGPWVTEFDGMAKKTCVRQLSKFMPKGTDLAVAMHVDDSVRVDVGAGARPELVSTHPRLEEVEQTAHVDEEEILGSVVPEQQEPPAETGEAVTTTTMARLLGFFEDHEITEPAERLAGVGTIVGRPVTKLDDLSEAEALDVVTRLETTAAAGGIP